MIDRNNGFQDNAPRSKAIRKTAREALGSLAGSGNVPSPDSSVIRVSQAAANIQSKDSFMTRLFPNALQRAIAEGELAQCKVEFQFRREALEIARRTQVDSLKEACNQYLVGQKAEARQQIASYLSEKTAELQDRLDNTFETFIVSMDKKMAAAERIEREAIRNIRVQQLQRDLEEFAILQGDLADSFRSIVSEGI
jgi:DNA-binding FadR family transcriptional regulator